MFDNFHNIHFELGILLKNPKDLKQALDQTRKIVEEKGIEGFFRGYSEVLNASPEGGRPVLDKGRISITNFELYFLLQNPNWIKKTVFLKNSQRLSPEEVKELLEFLSI
jgi:hypothetical protein